MVGDDAGEGEGADDDWLSRMWSAGGIALCVALAVYLSIVARRAVDEELGDDEVDGTEDERAAFLSTGADVFEDPGLPGQQMVERTVVGSATSSPSVVLFDASPKPGVNASVPDRFARGGWEESAIGV